MIHELLVWPEPFDAIRAGTSRATARRCDDRMFTAGDEIRFICAHGSEAASRTHARVLKPEADFIRARITRIERNAGPHGLYGLDHKQTVGLRLVAFAIIHFVVVDEKARS